MHPSPLYATGLRPAELSRFCEISRHFFGHAATQRPHPLQQSSSMFGLAIFNLQKTDVYYIVLRPGNQELPDATMRQTRRTAPSSALIPTRVRSAPSANPSPGDFCACGQDMPDQILVTRFNRHARNIQTENARGVHEIKYHPIRPVGSRAARIGDAASAATV